MTTITINIREIRVKVKLVDFTKYPDIKAQAFLSFADEHGRTFTISGFFVRKSKYPNGKGFWVTPPAKKGFQFFLAGGSLWKDIEKAIIEEFEKEGIPIIEE